MKIILTQYSVSKLATLSILALFMVAPSLATAKEIYYGASVASIGLTDDKGSIGKISFTTLYGRLGTKWNENITGEFRLGLASSKEKYSDQTLEIEGFGGVYMKFGTPVSDTFYPYAIIGRTRGKLGMSNNNSKSRHTASDTSFGVGVDVEISDSIAINLEYIKYIDKPMHDFAGFSLGFAFDL